MVRGLHSIAVSEAVPAPEGTTPPDPAPEAPPSREPTEAPAAADPVASAWSALQAHWDDEAKHKAFVGLAASFSRLPDAGRLYREAAGDPARRERAERGKQLVIGLAMATVEAMPRTERASKGAIIAPIAAILLLGAANFLVATVAHTRVPLSPWVFAVEIVLVLVIPWKKLQRGE